MRSDARMAGGTNSCFKGTTLGYLPIPYWNTRNGLHCAWVLLRASVSSVVGARAVRQGSHPDNRAAFFVLCYRPACHLFAISSARPNWR
jgi:hypothetical protein